jgi:6-phosphogluconate dehydrogenase
LREKKRSLPGHGLDSGGTYNRTAKPVAELAAEGLTPASDILDLVKKLDPPRAVWIMLPAGAVTDGMIDAMSELLSAGDILIDDGNTFYKDDIRRAKTLESKNFDRCRHVGRGLGP